MADNPFLRGSKALCCDSNPERSMQGAVATETLPKDERNPPKRLHGAHSGFAMLHLQNGGPMG
jgi:hypothetical protein